MPEYDYSSIEQKMQKYWQEIDAFKTDDSSKKPKAYILDMFPYPSGAGLHVGHVEGYTATDIVARYKRMNGFEVLHPMGWDAFGLPAENYAIKVGKHPRITTDENIQNFTKQINSIGKSIDWSREIDTSSEDYYKWSQWFFLLMYENGLAYRKEAPVNWCETDQTVLANEQVVNGACERCKNEVVQKNLAQWFFKVTAYADRLVEDLDALDWPESLKEMQRNWIGRSEGASIKFQISKHKDQIEVFTTRPDTLYGATYLVLAPEHPLVDQLTTDEHRSDIDNYIDEASKRTELERTGTDQQKSGVFTGAYAIHPITGEELPIWIADYVLMGYGTGAIMAVPAHDERDFEFAKKYDLPIVQVIEPSASRVVAIKKSLSNEFYKEAELLGEITEGRGSSEGVIYINSERIEDIFALAQNHFEGGPWYIHSEGPIKKILFHSSGASKIFDWSAQLKDAIAYGSKVGIQPGMLDFHSAYAPYTGPGILTNSSKFDGADNEVAKAKITKTAGGELTTTYRLRDWLLSRQRFWGAPIPIIHCDSCGTVPVPEKDLPVELPKEADFSLSGDGKSPLARVEEFVNTTCPKCDGPAKRETDTMDGFVDNSWYYFRYLDPKNEKSFADKKKLAKWMPVDLYVGGAEHAVGHLIYSRFFTKVLFDQGYIKFQEPFTKLVNQGLILAEDGLKMSKSLGNVVNPDDVIATYGADTLRLYEMFLGPLTDSKPWDTKGIIGMSRFLDKVYRLFNLDAIKPEGTADQNVTAKLHKTIAKVTEDIEHLHFNTAISAMMEFINMAQKKGELPQVEAEVFLKLLSPFAPHLAEYLWHDLGHEDSLGMQAWPNFDERLLNEETINLPVQVNGKLRDTIDVSADAEEAEVKKLALTSENVQKHIGGEEIKKVIFVKGRIINFIV